MKRKRFRASDNETLPASMMDAQSDKGNGSFHPDRALSPCHECRSIAPDEQK